MQVLKGGVSVGFGAEGVRVVLEGGWALDNLKEVELALALCRWGLGLV